MPPCLPAVVTAEHIHVWLTRASLVENSRLRGRLLIQMYAAEMCADYAPHGRVRGLLAFGLMPAGRTVSSYSLWGRVSLLAVTQGRVWSASRPLRPASSLSPVLFPPCPPPFLPVQPSPRMHRAPTPRFISSAAFGRGSRSNPKAWLFPCMVLSGGGAAVGCGLETGHRQTKELAAEYSHHKPLTLQAILC